MCFLNRQQNVAERVRKNKFSLKAGFIADIIHVLFLKKQMAQRSLTPLRANSQAPRMEYENITSTLLDYFASRY